MVVVAAAAAAASAAAVGLSFSFSLSFSLSLFGLPAAGEVPRRSRRGRGTPTAEDGGGRG